jgi:hypothetical protein
MPKTYSLEEKIRILKVLEINNFNYLKTQRDTGLHPITVKAWREKYGDKVFKKNQIEEIVERVDVVSEIQKDDFIKKAWDANKDIIERIKVLIPKEKKIFALASVMKIIHEIINSKGIPPIDKLDAQNIFQQINNKIIYNNDQKTNIQESEQGNS